MLLEIVFVSEILKFCVKTHLTLITIFLEADMVNTVKTPPKKFTSILKRKLLEKEQKEKDNLTEIINISELNSNITSKKRLFYM